MIIIIPFYGGKTCTYRIKVCSKLINKAVAHVSLEFRFIDTNLSFPPSHIKFFLEFLGKIK